MKITFKYNKFMIIMVKITSYRTCFVFKNWNERIKVLRYKLFSSQYRKVVGHICNCMNGTYRKTVLTELILQWEHIYIM